MSLRWTILNGFQHNSRFLVPGKACGILWLASRVSSRWRCIGLGALCLLLAGCLATENPADTATDTWSVRCTPSILVPEHHGCHAWIALEDRALAVFPEGAQWLIATGWIGVNHQLLQATLDVSGFPAGLRKSVRAEHGYCAGSVCWIEVSTEELLKLTQKRLIRVELTRVFVNEEGQYRRGTRGFHAPTQGLTAALQQITPVSSDTTL